MTHPNFQVVHDVCDRIEHRRHRHHGRTWLRGRHPASEAASARRYFQRAEIEKFGATVVKAKFLRILDAAGCILFDGIFPGVDVLEQARERRSGMGVRHSGRQRVLGFDRGLELLLGIKPIDALCGLLDAGIRRLWLFHRCPSRISWRLREISAGCPQ